MEKSESTNDKGEKVVTEKEVEKKARINAQNAQRAEDKRRQDKIDMAQNAQRAEDKRRQDKIDVDGIEFARKWRQEQQQKAAAAVVDPRQTGITFSRRRPLRNS